MREPLVSVCVPAYNAEKYMVEALDSVLGQTYPHIEIIVVNDGSTDGTKSVLDIYKGNDKLKAFHCPNKGAAASRNYAFNQSNGEYIKFFDADDVMSPTMIARQVEAIRGKHTEIASAAWGRFYNDDFSTYRPNPEKVWKNMKPIDWLVESMVDGPNMMQPGIFLIPRNIVQKVGLWHDHPSPIDDFEFMVRAMLAASFVRFVSGVELCYRSGMGQNSLSGSKKPEAMEAAFYSISSATKNLLKFENSARVRRVCADTFQLWAYKFYPQFPCLTSKAERKVQELGGSDYKIPSGKILATLAKVVGWKRSKRIQTAAYRLGYNP